MIDQLIVFGKHFVELFYPTALVLQIVGMALGVVIGALPGLNATLGIALLTPITFAVPNQYALAVLISLYVGVMFGGSISAILINIPGTGSAVATLYFTVALARSRALRGAILATPFDSIAAVGEERYPWLPVGLILNGRYNAAALAPKIKVPALFVLAENDDVTPVENGAALARAWGEPQKTLTLAGARHYGIERRPEFWSAVTDFLSAIEPAASRRDDYPGQLVTKP